MRAERADSEFINSVLRTAIDRLLLLIGIASFWIISSWFIGNDALPGPIRTFSRLWDIVHEGSFLSHVLETGYAFGIALLLATVGGLTLGLALGARRIAGEVAEPLLMAGYTIPKVTLYPIILLIFGLGLSAKIAFGVIHGIIPIAIFAMNAVRNLPSVYTRSARSMGLTRWQTAWTIFLPAIAPEVMSGFRIGFSLTLLGTLIGEMFASQRGLGYLIMKAVELGDSATIMALAVLIVTFASVTSMLILRADQTIK